MQSIFFSGWDPVIRTVVSTVSTYIILIALHRGEFVSSTMRRQRVGEADIRAAVRSHGFASLKDVGAVILEADGSFSVIERLNDDCSALADIPELGGSNEANKAK